jgi:hypothetical protein
MSPVHGAIKGWWHALVNTAKLIARGNRRYVGDGFEVEMPSTWEVIYREGERSLVLGTGIRQGGRGWWDSWDTIEAVGTLTWEPPYRGDIITAERRAEIISRVEMAFRAMAIPYEVLQ